MTPKHAEPAAPDATSEPAAEWVAIDALKPWKDNPRKNDPAVEKVAESIRRFGFGAPILARKANGEIIAGHTRVKAAAKLGIKTVPVRYLDLDPADAHLMALADNKTAEIAEWDDPMLGAILAQLKAEDNDLLDGTGFGQEDIDRLIADAGGPDPAPDPGAQIDRAAELQVKWQTAPGQLWEIPSKTAPERRYLTCGKCGHDFDV